MKRIKPLFKYAGGKIRLLKTYTPFFQGLRPEHCIDYFGGSGSMSVWFHQLYPDAKLYLNDKDPAIYGLFKCIKEDYEEFCLDLNYLETWIHSRWTETDTIEKNIEEMKKWYYMFREEQYNVTQEIPDEWHYANFEKHPEDYDEPIALEKELGCSIKGLSKRQIENLLSLNDNGWSLKEWEEMSGQNTPFEHA